MPTMLRIRAARMAVPQPLTLSPGTIHAVNISIRAFSNKRNSPSVRIVKGRVIRNRMGRTTAFTIAKITAASKAGTQPVTCSPGRNLDSTRNVAAITTKCNSVRIVTSIPAGRPT